MMPGEQQSNPATRRYRVIMPVEIAGREYEFGEVVALDFETAAQYAIALIEVEEE